MGTAKLSSRGGHQDVPRTIAGSNLAQMLGRSSEAVDRCTVSKRKLRPINAANVALDWPAYVLVFQETTNYISALLAQDGLTLK